MGIGEKDEGAAGSLVQEGPPAARKAPYRTVLRPRSVLMPRDQPVNINSFLMF